MCQSLQSQKQTYLQAMKRVVHCILQMHIGLISLVRGHRRNVPNCTCRISLLIKVKVAQCSMTNNMKQVTSS